MPGPSTDQISVFLAVVDQGSFAAAAKSLRRAQSAVTYAVRRLEDQLGLTLFDRTEYRAVLTEAGRALLPNARRVANGVVALRNQALSLAKGHEAQISIAVDSIFPMRRVREALRLFSQTFPAIPTQIHVASYERAMQLLVDEVCMIGLVNEEACTTAPVPLVTRPIDTVELVSVVAPSHALAAIDGPVSVEDMHDHVRLVLGEGVPASMGRGLGGFYGSLWFVNDIAAKRELLLTGVGWGIIPLHLVERDLASGRLRRLTPAKIDYPASGKPGEPHLVQILCAHRAGWLPGPASRWLLDYFAR
ncbi:MAG TPA: LysR family transcriptional regulator [Sphingomonadaceae bacterium]|nr:LysR family transcriptional regulator [Sphingomonadaceae bacterium]